MEAMTQEQRQKTKEALSRYGQKNWVYGPCNWGWKRAIQLAEEYYREADPVRTYAATTPKRAI
jgi:hypothetical protein